MHHILKKSVILVKFNFYQKRMEFSRTFLQLVASEAFIMHTITSDDANFYLTLLAKEQNCKFWSAGKYREIHERQFYPAEASSSSR